MLTGADTRYKVVGTEVSRSQFFDTVRRGDVIEAEGPLSGGTLQARSIEASYATVKGYSSDVNPDQGTFAVGDEVFYVEGVTHYDDGAQFADISEGTRVEIKWSSARPDDQQRRLAVDVQLKD